MNVAEGLLPIQREGLRSELHLHLVSDSTGETVTSLARACLVQFDHVECHEHVWSLVRSEFAIDQVIEGIKTHPGIVLFTLVDKDIRQKLIAYCAEHRLPSFSVMDHFLDIFSKYLGQPGHSQPGKQHQLDADYFARIDAMQYTLAHDDGLGDDSLREADILVTGVSRTSKTPTCMYLANRGYKAANIPMVPEVELPEWLLKLDKNKKPLVVCLIRDAESLVQIRRNRLKLIGPGLNQETDYVDIDKVKEEILASKRLSVLRNWPMIDVTRRSIEESAAAIINVYENRFSELEED